MFHSWMVKFANIAVNSGNLSDYKVPFETLWKYLLDIYAVFVLSTYK